MSEKERMLAGELYIAEEPELGRLHMKKLRLVQQYNTAAFDDFAGREAIMRELLGSVGKNFTIEPPVQFDYGCFTYIGDNFYANTDCIFLDVNPIRIGDNVMLGPRVGLYTPWHPIDAKVRAELLEGGSPITIGNDVWIGGGVTVCPGVTIGDDVVIGAGSVVVKDIPAHSVAVGNPCHVIRTIGASDRDYWRAKADAYRAAVAAERAEG